VGNHGPGDAACTIIARRTAGPMSLWKSTSAPKASIAPQTSKPHCCAHMQQESTTKQIIDAQTASPEAKSTAVQSTRTYWSSFRCTRFVSSFCAVRVTRCALGAILRNRREFRPNGSSSRTHYPCQCASAR